MPSLEPARPAAAGAILAVASIENRAVSIDGTRDAVGQAERREQRPIPRDLAPCARCGGVGVPGVAIRGEVVSGWVQCADCGHRTPIDMSYLEALETWNEDRAPELGQPA